MSKKHYKKNKPVPHLSNVAQTKKGLNETLEVLRNAEEGTALFDIYKSGLETDNAFKVFYDYLKLETDGDVIPDFITLYLGHKMPDGRYSLVFDIPKELNVPMDEVALKLSQFLPYNISVHCSRYENGDIYYFFLSSEFVRVFKDVIIGLDNCLKSWLKRNNTDVLKKALLN